MAEENRAAHELLDCPITFVHYIHTVDRTKVASGLWQSGGSHELDDAALHINARYGQLSSFGHSLPSRSHLRFLRWTSSPGISRDVVNANACRSSVCPAGRPTVRAEPLGLLLGADCL
jgi:hypothetical protein